MNTIQHLKQVSEFMKICGQEVNTEPTYQSTKVADFRTRLIDEEIYGKKELIDSINKDDLVGIADGLSDILYVAYGAIATFGTALNPYKIYKPDMRGAKLMHKHVAYALARDLGNAFQQYVRGVETGDMTTIGRGLTGIILEVNRIASISNIDLQGAFAEVHKSNMSKVCLTLEQAHDSIEERIAVNDDKSHEYVGATVESTDVNGTTYYVIRRATDGKVLKGNSFFEPDLKKFV